MKGLSSGALHSTTSLPQPSESLSRVASAVALMVSPIRRTASMLMPVLVLPTFTLEQMRSVTRMASGMLRMSSSSARVMPLLTTAL